MRLSRAWKRGWGRRRQLVNRRALNKLFEEVSKLLEAWSQAILNSGS